MQVGCVAIFQFHYGTIKSSNTPVCSSGRKRFQFHYGTIKRQRNLLSVVWVQYFNSTMVRLKVVGQEPAIELAKFQFHYGTIKSVATWNTLCPLWNFNSTMVRLKAGEPSTRTPCISVFQFHYGTIKRRKSRQKNRCNTISIPLWYD